VEHRPIVFLKNGTRRPCGIVGICIAGMNWGFLKLGGMEDPRKSKKTHG